MNNINRMIYEYVIPFIILTILLIPFWIYLGQALDKEIVFEDSITNHYRTGE